LFSIQLPRQTLDVCGGQSLFGIGVLVVREHDEDMEDDDEFGDLDGISEGSMGSDDEVEGLSDLLLFSIQLPRQTLDVCGGQSLFGIGVLVVREHGSSLCLMMMRIWRMMMSSVISMGLVKAQWVAMTRLKWKQRHLPSFSWELPSSRQPHLHQICDALLVQASEEGRAGAYV
jgi:hypothetical protein